MNTSIFALSNLKISTINEKNFVRKSGGYTIIGNNTLKKLKTHQVSANKNFIVNFIDHVTINNCQYFLVNTLVTSKVLELENTTVPGVFQKNLYLDAINILCNYQITAKFKKNKKVNS